ncbi:MAG: hypothetical protein B7Y19_07935, partial [Sphingobacteriales bacterium 24-40-4]
MQFPLHAQHDEHKMPAVKPQTIYTCPMHPEIQSDKPGNCPKCGMKLVVQKPKVSKPSTPVKKSPVTPAKSAPSTPAKQSQPAKGHDMEGMKMPAKTVAPVKDPSGTHYHENMKMPMNESHQNMDGMEGM